MSNEVYVYDVSQPDFHFEIAGKRYILRELSGAEVNRYTNARAESVIWKNGKLAGLRNPAGLQDMLLVLSIFDASGNRPPRDVVEGFPSRVKKDLFQRATEMNGLATEALDPLLESLFEALQRDDSPISMQVLGDFIEENADDIRHSDELLSIIRKQDVKSKKS